MPNSSERVPPFFPLPLRYARIVEAEKNAMLFETAKGDADNYRSLMFRDPVDILTTESRDKIPAIFATLERALSGGLFVAGYVAYECGFHFEPVGEVPEGQGPLLYLGVYRRPFLFDHRIDPREGEPAGGSEGDFADAPLPISNPRLAIDKHDYRHAIGLIKRSIASGDTYQINFTTTSRFQFEGSPAALYHALLIRQPVPYAAFIHTPERMVLSVSPELFFRLKEGNIEVQPMKGTMRRGRTREEDDKLRETLRSDEKNRAENLMIVDMLRNDIGRIAETGSVSVPEMFRVESYPTLFQMTSTIRGRVRSGTTPYDVFRSLFPPGSVTGAPKISSMRIIRKLELRRRGVYTGAIGFFSPAREAVFSVAIRTITLNAGEAEMGVGSGIVADSSAEEEYRECELKSFFLFGRPPGFKLIETLRWDNGYPFLALHLERIASSAEYFQIACTPGALSDALHEHAASFGRGKQYRVRLTLDSSGSTFIESTDLAGDESGAIPRAALAAVRTHSGDRYLYHKTTHRDTYDAQLQTARARGCIDVLFRNERGQVTEGAIHNIVVRLDGRWITPPVMCGLLNGVFRRHLVSTRKEVEEAVLTLDDLRAAEELYLCNAVHGLRRVTLGEDLGALDEQRRGSDRG